MPTDPRIRALAKEANAKIKTLTDAHKAEIEAIYKDFRIQASAISGEASADRLHSSSADLLPKTQINESERDKTIMSSTINYVADHIDRIERRHGGKESLILAQSGGLPQPLAQVDAYILRFKATPAGKEAIAIYQRKAS